MLKALEFLDESDKGSDRGGSQHVSGCRSSSLAVVAARVAILECLLPESFVSMCFSVCLEDLSALSFLSGLLNR
ncbi:hypothetical protein F2Q70_00041615 [Brassica cretica]|uniref:Uncharacterized protein n=1 Tax=Brassica cretica TaxID=69181 RepID=A0A8S9K6B7_BRACR|nr:hypothetical protein F2Q70_00041615 [Brassica cretica]